LSAAPGCKNYDLLRGDTSHYVIKGLQISAFGSGFYADSVNGPLPAYTPPSRNSTADVYVGGQFWGQIDASHQPSLQAALSQCSGGVPIVRMTPGVYNLTSGLTSNCPGLQFVAEGGGGDELSAANPSAMAASVIIVVPSGQVGFTYNPSATSTIFDGPTIRGICFVGANGALGGIDIKRTNNFTIEHSCASYFSTGYGIFSDGTGNVNQYGVIENNQINGDNIGIKTVASSDRIMLNHIDGAANGGSAVVSGSKGIYGSCPSGQQSGTKIIGDNDISGFDILVDLECGENDVVKYNRLENFITDGVLIQALNGLLSYGEQVIDGSINNYINGSVGTGIAIGSGVSNAKISNPNIASVATPFTDAGTNTQPDINGTLKRQAFTGPATAPSGSCAVNGLWVLSQDGHVTYCASGTWTTKI
jgi:hypothetical protein